MDTSLPTPPPGTLSLARDLSGVPPGAAGSASRCSGFHGRRLLIAAGLFGYLGYLTNPGPQRSAAIQSLRRISHEALTPAAAARGAEIDAAFETLEELNREGLVGFRHIWRAARVVAAATADGEFGDRDVERLLMTVGAIHKEPPPGPLKREPAPGPNLGIGPRRAVLAAGCGAPRSDNRLADSQSADGRSPVFDPAATTIGPRLQTHRTSNRRRRIASYSTSRGK